MTFQILLCRYLIEQKADVAAVNNDGELAIDISESDEMEELLQKEIDAAGIDCEVSKTELTSASHATSQHIVHVFKGVSAHGGADDAGGRDAVAERQQPGRHAARQDRRHRPPRRRRQGIRQGHEVSPVTYAMAPVIMTPNYKKALAQ